jgi:hypothetical protein
VITNNTEELLKRRTNDFRIDFAHYILFGDKIREDIEKNNKTHALRKAQPRDMLVYNIMPDSDDIKNNIAQNIANITKLRNSKQLNNLKQMWLFCYDIDKNEAKKTDGVPDIVTFINPDAADVTHIFKQGRIILGTILAIEYENEKGETTIIEWAMLSPGDDNNLDEYNECLKEIEIEKLKEIFLLDFHKTDDKASL